MKHRHLTHEDFSSASIEDILDRGKMPAWVALIDAIRADPHGEVAEKTHALCARPLYAAPVFRRVIAAARQEQPSGSMPTDGTDPSAAIDPLAS